MIPFTRKFWLVFLVSTISFAQGPQKRNIAVIDLESRGGISPSEASTLTDRLRSMLVQTNSFVVIERGKMDAVLKEVGFQQTGCTTTECAVEIGKILNVTEMVTGAIGKLGTRYTIDISTVDVATSEIKTSITRDYRGDIEGLLDVMEPIAYQLSGKEAPAPQVPVPAAAPVLAAPEPEEESFAEIMDAGSLKVSGYPENAAVYVDDKPVGALPLNLERISPGEHLIRLEAKGYESQQWKAKIEKRRTAQYKKTLRKLVPIHIVSEPSDAEVFLNNQPIGKTPLSGGVGEGTNLNVRLRKTNYADWVKDVVVAKGMEVSATMEYSELYKDELRKQGKSIKKSKDWVWIGAAVLVIGGGVYYFIKEKPGQQK